METENIFLLGGQDLEMREIATLLQEHNCVFYDRQLDWSNATVTAYADLLEKYGPQKKITLYGVELTGETAWENYKRIDHHNDLNNSPASIEQIASLLKISLSRYQLLIAANDKGYIPAMQALGATPDEIAKIRREDRAAQGVTPQEEEMAEEAVSTQTVCGEALVIYSKSNRFSPICDRLWPYKKLLIYTNETLCYYGLGKDKLAAYFDSEISVHKMYHGGGPDGYLGTVEGAYTSLELLQIKTRILRMN